MGRPSSSALSSILALSSTASEYVGLLGIAGKRLNADLNAAVNIAHRAGCEVVIKKIESYRVTHKGVIPVTLYRGEPETPASKPRPGRAERGSSLNTAPPLAILAVSMLKPGST